MADLPDHILSEILAKLPTKSLLRLRCVSKQWHDLIDSPSFIALHLAANANTVHIMRRTRFGENNFHSLTFDLPKNIATVKSELECPINMLYSSFVGTCNGVICLAVSLPTPSIVFWNPTTDKCKQGPSLKDIHSYRIGFGFDAKSNEYKLVIVSAFGRSMRRVVRIYSLKSDSWSYGQTCYGVLVSGKFVFVSGAVHWLARHVKSSVMTTAGIDVSTGKWRWSAPLPESVRFPLDFNPLIALGGALCVVSTSGAADVDVYAMKGKSWNKVFSISTFGFETPRPLGYGANGKQVLVVDEEGFKWYDIEKKTILNTDVESELGRFEMFVCGESHAVF